MTKIIDNVLIIQKQSKQICELCGNEAETRPYGPNGENVCFDCGMKDEAAAELAFSKILDQVDFVIAVKDVNNDNEA